MLTTLRTTSTKHAIFGTTLAAALLLGLAPASPVGAGGARCQARTALDAVGDDQTAAIESLRSLGPAAVSALWDEIRRDPDWAAHRESWAGTLDKVCGMKDCAEARLFWTTDLEEALRRARDTGRPVLSLRLLGRLDEELSCANSRLFRLALYTHPRISEELRDRWVLHWHTVREVPTVTVRFGPDRAGGERSLQGTITGNSIHYVLDARGRIVDALPGLYAPRAFLEALTLARQRAADAARQSDAEFLEAQSLYHQDGLRRASRVGFEDLSALGVLGPSEVMAALVNREVDGEVDGEENGEEDGEEAREPGESRGEGPAVQPRLVSARDAARFAATKATVEAELLDAVVLDRGLPGSLGPAIDWAALGRRHPEWNGRRPVHLELLRRRLPAGADLGPALETLRRLLLTDTAQNELLLRPILRRWLSEDGPQRDLEAFDERVYEGLFRTPLSDPWLGLSPETLYTALRPVEPPQLVGR